MTYSECIDDTDYTSTSIWNNLQYISASGPSDICSPKWIRSLERKLDTFRSLQENWDSYGAHPINDGALENAKQFLNSALFSGLEKPLVAATSRGGVHVEWDNNGRALEQVCWFGRSVPFRFDRVLSLALQKNIIAL